MTTVRSYYLLTELILNPIPAVTTLSVTPSYRTFPSASLIEISFIPEAGICVVTENFPSTTFDSIEIALSPFGITTVT